VSARKEVVIAIDGPAASGKSTVARELARRLGIRYLDTGAMYRTLAWAAIEKKIDLSCGRGLVKLLDDFSGLIRDSGTGRGPFIDGEDIGERIRSAEVTAVVKFIADSPEVRERMRRLQRDVASEGSIVAEGRDMTSAVFPEAQVKVYLDATPEVRAKRRFRELLGAGEQVSLQEVLRDINRRDEEDRSRAVAPLLKVPDALYIDSSDKSADEVVSFLENLIRQRLGNLS